MHSRNRSPTSLASSGNTDSDRPDAHMPAADRSPVSKTQEIEGLDETSALQTEQERLIGSGPNIRIPTEMLVKIFRHCLDMNTHRLQGSLSTAQPPWVVSQVCRTWREAALGAPLLWSDIHIGGNYPPRLLAHRIQHQLLRSGSCPLRIQVYSDGYTDECWAAVPQLLFSHCNRIEAMIIFDNGSFLYRRVNFQQFRFPILRYLHFSTRITTHNPAPDLFHSCPDLRNLHFSGSPTIISPYSFPWSQLTRLSCEPNDIGKMHGVLPLLVNVIYLQLHGYYDGLDPVGDLEPVLLRSVEQLIVDEARYCRILTMPRLRNFTLSMQNSDPLGVLAFLSRSQCNILSFSIIGFRTYEVVVRLLDALPEMTSFFWTYPSQHAAVLRPEEIITALSSEELGGSFSYCPKLKSLSIRNITAMSSPRLGRSTIVDRILDMIERRTVGRHGEETIRRVQLINVGERSIWKSDDTRARVGKIREGGVELIVHGSAYPYRDRGPVNVVII